MKTYNDILSFLGVPSNLSKLCWNILVKCAIDPIFSYFYQLTLLNNTGHEEGRVLLNGC